MVILYLTGASTPKIESFAILKVMLWKVKFHTGWPLIVDELSRL